MTAAVGPMNVMSSASHRLAKLAFRQQAIPGVDGLCTVFYGRDDRILIQIALTHGRRSNTNGYVSRPDMWCIFVSIGIYGNAANG